MSYISSIDPNNSDTFRLPILTFDVDWAHDDILSDSINIVEQYNHSAVWMMTHQTDLVYDIKNKKRHEIGVHPNFNYLLNGDNRNGSSAEEVLDKLMTHYPDSLVVRSHSIVQSSRLSELFHDRGLRFESNDYLPPEWGGYITPWQMPCGIVKVPYFFSDEIACISSGIEMASLLGRPGLKIFDFHPIHVFLNTENLDRYERTRPLHRNPKELIKYRYEGYGTRNRLIEFLELARL
jgi:hypothetical protein